MKRAKEGLSSAVDNAQKSGVGQSTAKGARSIGRSIWGLFSSEQSKAPTAAPAKQVIKSPYE